MIPTGNDNINSKVYWNYIYTTPAKLQEYWTTTNRFPRALTYIKDGDKVIDLGCGVGVLERLIKKEKKGCEIWGVDISNEAIKNDLDHDPDIKYQQGEIGNLSKLPEDYFDVVFSGEVIEHLDHPEDLFNDAQRILKKGGKLIVTTPQDKHVDSPEHVWYFTKDDVNTLFTTTGFTKPTYEDLPDLEHIIVFFAVGEKI
jgi:ubiquinone/menaquinone biosynthesis C-methylase UbiE